MAQLTEEHLKELQVSLGDRLRLIKAIEAFETSSTEKSEALLLFFGAAR